MNEPIAAKKPPEVKPWVRRGIEGRALCAFQPSSTTANHRQRRAAPARGKERKPSPRCSASTAASDRRGSVLECSSPLWSFRTPSGLRESSGGLEQSRTLPRRRPPQGGAYPAVRREQRRREEWKRESQAADGWSQELIQEGSGVKRMGLRAGRAAPELVGLRPKRLAEWKSDGR